MIVGQSLPPPVARGAGPDTQQLLADGTRSALSFAELLMTDAPSLAGEELAFTSSGQDFRGTVTVGEDAIRFDARPVVAPAHHAVEDDLGLALEDQTAGAGAWRGPAVERLEPGRPLGDLDAGLPTLAPSEARGHSLQPSGSTAQVDRIRGVRSSASLPTAAFSHGSQVSSPADHAGDPVKRTMVSPNGNARVNEARLPASVTVLPHEVLVVVHGMALSASEQKALLQDVRELLSVHGLGDRVVRLSAQSRRTP